MAEPSEKAPEMEQALDDLTQQAFGRSRTESIRGNVCVGCGGPAEVFSDPVSRQEYRISGLCQQCQDQVFADPDDEEE